MLEETKVAKEQLSNNGLGEPSGSNSMALDKLLKWDGDLHIEEKLRIERLDLDVTIRAVPQEELEKYNNQAMEFVKNRATQAVDRQVDNVKLGRLTVFNCVVDPDLGNEELQKLHNTDNGKMRDKFLIVNRIFLPGEIVMLSEAILSLSGFSGGAYMSEAEKEENLS